jgi:signal transduction histidine kinase
MAQALSQRLPTSETHILKMLSRCAPVMEVLNELCNFIGAKSPGVIPTILLPDDDGHLRLAAGPEVPKAWNEALDGMKAPFCASCLNIAGHQERPFPIADMRSDPSFAACWHLALSQGVQAAWSVPILSKERKILGTLVLFYPTPQPPAERDLELMELVIHMAAISIESHHSEEELRAYCRRLHQSQDEERRRIARELHDSTGQELALLTMNLSLVKDKIPTQSREVENVFSQCLSLTTSISDELRTLSYLLHPPLLDDCGLETAIQWYVSGISQRKGPHVVLEITHDLRRLTEEAELAIFRVVQASLTNVHLHSKATEAIIKIEQNSDEVIVTVGDNGRGMPDGMLEHSSRVTTVGVGIAGMQERMEQLGGRLEIETSCCGTKVKARVPKTNFRTAT